MRRPKPKAFVIVSLFLGILLAFSWGLATDYYVSQDDGNDSYDGLYPTYQGGSNGPWLTIAKVNASSFNAGDNIYFNKGDTWREQLTVPSSGSSGNPITFGAYGTGDKPIINGSDLVTGWINDSGNVWRTTLANESHYVWIDGNFGDKKTAKGNLVNEYDWYHDGSTTLYIYSATDPDIAYTSPGIEATTRHYGIKVGGKEYLTIQNINTKHCHKDGIILYNYSGSTKTDITIDSCKTEQNARHGFLNYSESGQADINNVTISNCEVYKNQQSGLRLTVNGSNWTVENNTIYENCRDENDYNASGIKLFSNGTVTNVTIQNNEIYDNGWQVQGTSYDIGIGVWIDTVGSGMIVRYNKIYHNLFHGICFEIVTGAKAYYNLCYNNGDSNSSSGVYLLRDCNSCLVYNNATYGNKVGLSIRGDATADCSVDNVIKNNIASGNTIREFRATRGGENDGINGHGNVYEYNCLGAEASNFIEWGDGTYKSTYDAWESAYGSGTNSAEADPLMTDPANDDFTLKMASPCVDAGTDVGLTEDYEGKKIRHAPDIGAHEEQTNALFMPLVEIILGKNNLFYKEF